MPTLLSRPCTLVMHPRSTSHTRTTPTATAGHAEAAPCPQQPRGAGTAAAPLGRAGKLRRGQAGFTQGRSASPISPGGGLKPGATRPPGLPASGEGRGGPAPMCLTGRKGEDHRGHAPLPPAPPARLPLPRRGVSRAGGSGQSHLPAPSPFRAGVRRAPSPLPALPRAGRCAAPTDLAAAACCSRSLPPPPPPGLMRGPRRARSRAAGEDEEAPPLLLLLPVEPSGRRRGERRGRGLVGRGRERRAAWRGRRRGGQGREERAGPAGAPPLANSFALSPSPAPPSWEQRGYRRGASSEDWRRAGVGVGGAGRRTNCVPACNAGRGGGRRRQLRRATHRAKP